MPSFFGAWQVTHERQAGSPCPPQDGFERCVLWENWTGFCTQAAKMAARRTESRSAAVAPGSVGCSRVKAPSFH